MEDLQAENKALQEEIAHLELLIQDLREQIAYLEGGEHRDHQDYADYHFEA